MNFSAHFYDRQTGQNYPATVEIRRDAIHIFSVSDRLNLQWSLAEIDSATDHDGQIILQNGKLFLEINNPNFRSAFDQNFPKSKLFRQRGFFDKIGLTGCLVTLLFVILLPVGFYFWGVPKLADRAAQHVSPETEQKMGDALFASFTQDFPVDSVKTRLVQQFFDQMKFEGEYDFRLTVVREKQMNAFAVPGGRIVVFDSIISMMETPEELAGLLGHEASHVFLKHSVRSIFRELGNSMAISLLFGNSGDAVGLVAQQADQLRGLSYSRDFEIEADENGLKLMIAAGIPPRGMVSLFEKMKNTIEKTGATDAPSFLSTHPSMGERIDLVNEKIGKMNGLPTAVKPELAELFLKIKQ